MKFKFRSSLRRRVLVTCEHSADCLDRYLYYNSATQTRFFAGDLVWPDVLAYLDIASAQQRTTETQLPELVNWSPSPMMFLRWLFPLFSTI